MDVLLHEVGPSSRRLPEPAFLKMCLLLYLTNGDTLVYKMRETEECLSFRRMTSIDNISRPYIPTNTVSGKLPQRAAKAGTAGSNNKNSGGVNGTGPSVPSSSSQAGSGKANSTGGGWRTAFRYPMFSRFDDVNGRSGVFFRGFRPSWILSERGALQILPLGGKRYGFKFFVAFAMTIFVYVYTNIWTGSVSSANRA